MASRTEVFQVLDSFNGSLDGVDVEYQKGEVVEADDPGLKKWPDLFGPLVFRARPAKAAAPVEKATAAPGEKRGA